jgi:hypothetical protein
MFDVSTDTQIPADRKQDKIYCPWTQSAIELYRLSNSRFSATLVPTFEDLGCRVVSATDLQVRILDFLDLSHYIFFQISPQFYSQGRGIEPRTSGSVDRNFPQELHLDFNGLHGVISQKTELFISIGKETSNSTRKNFVTWLNYC